ncbi:hypothetical protein IAT40_003546 [Kwoniella sp. CBS 6097]
MARASSSRYLPRESIYPTPTSSDYLNYLEDCVQATENCSRTLGNAITRFEGGTRDMKRICKVMRHKHHYLVLPEPTIVAHKSALGASLAPQIEQLIVRAEGLVGSEKAKVANLEERLRILESARLPPPSPPSISSHTLASQSTSTNSDLADVDTSCKITDVDMKGLSIFQRKKIMMLKQKRERLEREMRRLQPTAPGESS